MHIFRTHFCGAEICAFNGPLAQLVEQRPFKAWVDGSNPSRLIFLRLHRLVVRTPGFHLGNGGSIPPGDAIFKRVTLFFDKISITYYIINCSI